MHEWLAPYATGLAALVGIAVVWMWIQNAWRRVVLDGSEDSDGLAGHCGCLGCERAARCEGRSSGEGT